MTNKTDKPVKVSPALASTLADLPDTAIVRVVLFLNLPTRTFSGRLTTGERTRALAEARSATSGLLEQLRPTLDAAGASRVDDGGMASLGGVVLDVPVGGVARLAHAEQVRLILGEQPLATPGRSGGS